MLQVVLVSPTANMDHRVQPLACRMEVPHPIMQVQVVDQATHPKRNTALFANWASLVHHNGSKDKAGPRAFTLQYCC